MRVTPDMLRDAHRGDRKAQYLLYKQCFPVLMSVCARYRYGEQDAVAAVNQGFLKIIQNLDKLPEGANFEAWIRRIQINQLIDQFRRQKKYREHEVHPEDFEVTAAIHHKSAPAINEGAAQMEAGYLERLLQKLPPITQQVFNLFAVDGFSHAEIGEMLGISDGTSKWHVNAARTQLKTWLENAYGTHR
jgi:RNA polymerase sigma factor (sigma-70 family)